MSAPRTTQHRPSRDAQKAKEMVDLKSENRQLRRQLARLQKEIGKLKDTEDDKVSEVQDIEMLDPVPAVSAAKTCPACGSEKLGTYTTPMGKSLTACRSCKKWKQRSE